jgi:hypothetical protein
MDSSLPRRIPQHTIGDTVPPKHPPAPVNPCSVPAGQVIAADQFRLTRLRPAHTSNDLEPAA